MTDGISKKLIDWKKKKLKQCGILPTVACTISTPLSPTRTLTRLLADQPPRMTNCPCFEDKETITSLLEALHYRILTLVDFYPRWACFLTPLLNDFSDDLSEYTQRLFYADITDSLSNYCQRCFETSPIHPPLLPPPLPPYSLLPSSSIRLRTATPTRRCL